MPAGPSVPAAGFEFTELQPRTLSPSRDSFPCVFGQREFGRCFVNCLFPKGSSAGPSVVVPAIVAFPAAQVVRRFRFRFRTAPPITFRTVLAQARSIPVEALAIHLVLLPRNSGRPNMPGTPIRPHAAFSVPRMVSRSSSPGPWPSTGIPSSRPGTTSRSSSPTGRYATVSTVMTIQAPIFLVRVHQRPASGLGGGKGLKDGWT
jgi:hypothetical protein